MGEFLAFYILCGLVVNMIAILKFKANPPALEVVGATLMWPLVLLQLIGSMFRNTEDDN